MAALPFRLLTVRSDLSGARETLAEAVPPGEKLPLATLMQQIPMAGRPLAMAWASTMAPLADAHFREPAAAVLDICTIRHHTTQAVAGHAPWHTDANFFGWTGGRGLTFWLTLDAAGQTAPGVQFAVDGCTMTPVVPAGAALMFGPEVMHRTQPAAGTRVSCEFRCVPAAAVAPGRLARDLDVLATELRDGCRWLLVRRAGATLREALVMTPATPGDRPASAG